MIPPRRIQRRRNGRFRIRLRPGEADVIIHLIGQLDMMLGSGDSSTVRLFPPAYGADDERSEGYTALADGELIESRRRSIETAHAAIDAGEVGLDGLNSLMRAVNDLRLVIGTRIDVSEDGDDLPPPESPDAELWVVYHVLGNILHDVVRVLSDAL